MAPGRLNVKQEEIDEMLKEAAQSTTVFLTFGEKLKDEALIQRRLSSMHFKYLKKDFVTKMLTTQAYRFSSEEMEQMFAAFPPDGAGNLDYKNLVHIITHGEED